MKELLLETLNQTLSPDKSVRQLAERNIKTLELEEEYAVCLTEIIVQCDAALALRQLCCVLLKQYVNCHWCSKDCEKFVPPETSENAKCKVRNLLPLALHENLSRIRTGAAYAIASIAHYDWPDAWPNLFDILAQLLKSGNANLVHGAMRVFVEFSHDITDKQIEYVAPVLFPECLNIFVKTEAYSIRTRSRAIELFNTLSGIIYFVSEVEKGVPKRLLFPYLQRYEEAFALALQLPDDGLVSDPALKAEVIKAISNLIERFPKQSKRFITQIFPIVFALFTNVAEHYVHAEVNGDKEDDCEVVDSDGETVGLEKLIFALVEFFENVLDQKSFGQTIRTCLPNLIYLILIYMQICDDKMDEWSSCVEKFVEDEDEESSVGTVRSACLDLLLSIADKWPQDAARALCLAVDRHLIDSENRKESDSNWWKIQECSCLAMGNLAPYILDYTVNSTSEFNLNNFLSNYLSKALQCSDHVLLQGQALWLASRFSQSHSPETLQNLIQLCCKGLSADQNQLTKCLAAKSLYNFCEYMKRHGSAELIHPYIKEIVANLIALGLKGSETLLNLALSTVAICTELNLPLDETTCNTILSLSKAAVLKYSGDPVIPSYACSIVKNLVSKPQYTLFVQQKMLPTLLSVLRNEKQAVLPIRLQTVCLEVLESLVRGCQVPLSDLLIKEAFPIVVHCVLTTDDTHTLQSGRECIRAFISKSANQIINWVDETGTVNGISLLVQVICRLLDPNTSELSASMVGRLIYILLRRADQALAPYLEQILGAVLNKMQSSELPAVHQSLLMVFAHLIHYNLEAVLTFLSSGTSPDGTSALEYVFKIWCDKQRIFLGAYDQKISTLALCKVMQQVLTKGDQILMKATVDDDSNSKQTTEGQKGYALRSKSQSKTTTVTTKIPLLVKLFKLILAELDHLFETPVDLEHSFVEDESESGEESDHLNNSTSSTKSSSTQKDVLPEILASIVNDLEEDSSSSDDQDEDDPDIKEDPRSQLNLKSELIGFLAEFCRQPFFKDFDQYLTPIDRNVLKKANIIVVVQ